jgi:hypothetical protein
LRAVEQEGRLVAGYFYGDWPQYLWLINTYRKFFRYNEWDFDILPLIKGFLGDYRKKLRYYRKLLRVGRRSIRYDIIIGCKAYIFRKSLPINEKNCHHSI